MDFVQPKRKNHKFGELSVLESTENSKHVKNILLSLI